MKRLLARLKKDERGLTLVELLAVVVILAIIGGIAFVLIGNVIENSKKDAHVANALQMIASAKLYEANGGTIDTSVTLKELQEDGVFGTALDPWEREAYDEDDSLVEKGTDGYTATLETNNAVDCTLSAVPEETLLKGRKEACDSTTTTGP